MRSSPDGHSPGLPAVLAATANRFSRSGIGVLLFLAPAALAAQTAIVVGRVSDAASTKPVVGASVVIDGSTLGATTGADGRYRLVNVPAGARVLVARRIGFGAQRVTITVPSSGEVTANFSLSASAISLDQVVVTGTAGAQEKRSIGNAVATINASEELRKSGATTSPAC
jgi:hypothetical protein